MSDAKEHGAKIVCGGKISELGGSFYEPTVLADATNDMSVSQEETFGPVAPVIRYVIDLYCTSPITRPKRHESGFYRFYIMGR